MVRVRLTPEGLRCVDSAMETLVESEYTVLETLSAADRESLACLLRELLLPFDGSDEIASSDSTSATA